MFLSRTRFKTKSGKIYEAVLLRESYREGPKVKKRTIANLSHCSKEEIAAIELALAHKHNLSSLTPSKPLPNRETDSVSIKEGKSIGGLWVIYQVAKQLGIVEVLGKQQQGKRALWQIIARVLEQGSRLSSVRLAGTYDIASVLSLTKGFTEDALYRNLAWLSKNQSRIEDRLFTRNQKNTTLFLYDVTSSYLEGTKNQLADWGYNRDGKKGKKQIVVGLLTNQEGDPISTEVFTGNTNDINTFRPQIEKVKHRFGCQNVTFVGDRGMIKNRQIEDLRQEGFHYITSLTKKQIQTLIQQKTIQYELFDTTLKEIVEGPIRYIFRRNPIRAQEIRESRASKERSMNKLVEKENRYLQDHPRAKEVRALKTIKERIKKLKVDHWIEIKLENRTITLSVNHQALGKEEELDGCYVIKTDLPQNTCDAPTIHNRYKDLATVERAFRTCKSLLELRPLHVRRTPSTYGHVVVVMLAYMIIQYLDQKWAPLYLTVEEGLRSLNTLTLQEVTVKGQETFQQIPEPREQNKKMLEKLYGARLGCVNLDSARRSQIEASATE